MSALKKICFLTVCGILVFFSLKGEVLAEIDGVPLSAKSMHEVSRKMLPEASLSGDVREVKIAAAVMTEVKLRETFQILSEQNISVNEEIARWYIVRCKERCSFNSKILSDALEKMVGQRDFQLKCAVYKYISLCCPEKLILPAGAAKEFYFRNQMQYRLNTPGVYKVVAVSSAKEGAAVTVGDIRSAMLQGETPERVASRFGAVCRISSPEEALKLSRLKLAQGGVSQNIMLGNDLCAVLCVTAPGNGFIPFDKLEPLIEEEILSRRAGAAFDEILQKRLSRIIVKYRR